MSATRPCDTPLELDRDRQPHLDGPRCQFPRHTGKQKCVWHWLLKQPIEVQIRYSELRRKEADDLGMDRARVPSSEWPEGTRWCAGCQSFIPLLYISGSRCKACSSRAAHASHVQRTYDLAPADYDALLEWQGGVCYICRQVPRVRRLAVDHDHRTNEVRGLICANDEWGCNTQLARLLNDVDMARRALEYVELPPLQRMRQGYPGRERQRPISRTMQLLQEAATAPAAVDLAPWDPFGSRTRESPASGG